MTLETIRAALVKLDLESSHRANQEPEDQAIYPVEGHDFALGFERPLVIGNRGMGKSFWAAVLTHDATRRRAAELFPRADLDKVTAILGFHENAGLQTDEVAPSSAAIAQVRAKNVNPEVIWQAVVLRACARCTNAKAHSSFSQEVRSLIDDPLLFETRLRKADQSISQNGSRLLIVFDGLDRLARDWKEIRVLSSEVLRLALQLGGTRSIRAKVFMRSDQARDNRLFQFPDASKLWTRRVELNWARPDLYGLLYSKLLSEKTSTDEMKSLIKSVFSLERKSNKLPDDLKFSEESQSKLFSHIAGQYMGSDRRRGFTYSWVYQHLADAFEQTSPRSFILALSVAAQTSPRPKITAVDYTGIKAGVVAASLGRLQELKEDNAWIEDALSDLEGLEVPCPPSAFERRWRDKRTLQKIDRVTKAANRPGPVFMDNATSSKETALLESLKALGVIESRGADRINMPDLFRVAAQIKRRGGVKPPRPA